MIEGARSGSNRSWIRTTELDRMSCRARLAQAQSRHEQAPVPAEQDAECLQDRLGGMVEDKINFLL